MLAAYRIRKCTKQITIGYRYKWEKEGRDAFYLNEIVVFVVVFGKGAFVLAALNSSVGM